jgi:hypothetical protein
MPTINRRLVNDTIALQAVLVESSRRSASMVDYSLKINGSVFHPEHPLDLISLVKSCQWSGPLDIFTCECGGPGCAGIFQQIEVAHTYGATTWECPAPLSVSDDMIELWIHDVTSFEHFSFAPDQYVDAINSGIKSIKSLAISSLKPIHFPVHGVELEQVLALETRPFSTHTMEPERRILARQVVVDAYHGFVTVDGVGYQMEDLNLGTELMHEYLAWESIGVFPNEEIEISAYMTYLQSGRSFCRALRKYIGSRTIVKFKYHPPSIYNRDAWEIIEIIR